MKEPILAGVGDDDVVVLRSQARGEDLRQFPLILDDQDPHNTSILAGAAGRQSYILLTFA